MLSNGVRSNKMRVCVVGGGAAGLCAARHLLARSDRFDFVVYEQTDKIGGTWNYTDEVGVDKNGLPIHSSMYKHLRTNLPIEIMAFPDFEWKRVENSFPHHQEVLNYLQKYAQHFELQQFVKFFHHVVNVKREESEWKVACKNLKTDQVFVENYDAIIVCNGRHSKPYFPEDIYNQLKDSNIQVIHTHDYRTSDPFLGKRVFILGAGPSGIDICLEISKVAEYVYLCHQLKEKFVDFPHNTNQFQSMIESVDGSNITLKDGNVVEVDVFIFATGYIVDFDLIDENCGIKVKNKHRILNLYMHMINIEHPTMAKIGILEKYLPFPFFHQQILFFLKTLTKEVLLPSKDQMLAECEQDFQRRIDRGLPEKHAHKMFPPFLWEYDDKLSKMGDLTPLSDTVRQIFDYMHLLRDKYMTGYREFNLTLD
ncbi:flavin-containing monooxygenase FMO GS-OX-like 2, partial [Dinothrombium tinctorium]